MITKDNTEGSRSNETTLIVKDYRFKAPSSGGLNVRVHFFRYRPGVTTLTRLIVRSTALALLIPSCFAFRSDSFGQDCRNERGWFIRILDNKTEASGVRLQIGFGGVESSHQDWREWRHGQPTQFSVPTKFLHANEIFINGISLDRGKNVGMCIGFNDHITKEVCFDNAEPNETSRDDEDGCEC